MIKGCKIFFKRKAMHDNNAVLNLESIHFFVFSISYTISEIIKKLKKNTKKIVLQKTSHLSTYHLFFSQLRVNFFFF